MTRFAGVEDAARAPIAAAVVVAMAICAAPRAAKTDITAQFDKTFSFAGLRTWAWHPDGAGDVKLAITADSDPKRVAARVDPVIVPAIERELLARGFSRVDGPADLYVHYYVLGTVQTASQYMGQFLAPVPEWGVPPFAPVTTSIEIFPFGTLLIDMTSPAKQAIVWRGSAQRKLDIERPDSERRRELERAIHDVVRQFPPPPRAKK
jgi:Domain of unknown function (DUF4136)